MGPIRTALLVASASLAHLLAAAPARADAKLPPYLGNGFALDAFSPAPAGDRFLLVPDATAAADAATHELSTRLLANRAIQPLAIESAGGAPSWSSALNLSLGMALAVGRYFSVNAELPIILKQQVWINNPSAGLPPSSPVAAPAVGDAGDMRVGLRIPIPFELPKELTVAGAADLWFKSGDQGTLTGDGALRLALRINASGEHGGAVALVYAASAGLLLGPTAAFGGSGLGSGVPLKAAVGLRYPGWNPKHENYFLSAIEYLQTVTFQPDTLRDIPFSRRSPGELMLSTSESLGTYDGRFTLRAGVGAGLTAAPGVPEARVVLGIEYTNVTNKHHR